ncbi:hypothetical protein Ddc_10842 [Ditylenchus destructor]|nr:hypothetical protein Ddc_10842 [Ditylenchus destructor]
MTTKTQELSFVIFFLTLLICVTDARYRMRDEPTPYGYSSFGADNPMEVFRKRRSPDSAPFRIRSVNLDDIFESRLRNDGIV